MESFSIKNIKSFKDKAEIEIKPITIIVGRNSCGKSSLIRFPVVLAQSSNNRTTGALKFYGDLIDYGNYEDVVCGHGNEPIEFSLKLDMDIINNHSRLYIYLPKVIHGEVELVATINKIDNQVVIVKNDIYIDGLLCFSMQREDGGYSAHVYYVLDSDLKSFVKADYSLSLSNIDIDTHSYQIDFDYKTDLTGKIKHKYFNSLSLGGWTADDVAAIGFNAACYDKFFKGRSIVDETDKKHRFKKFMNKVGDTPFILEYIRVNLSFELYRELLFAFGFNSSSELLDVSYVGPFRNNPERIYRDEEFDTDKVGVKGEHISTVLIRDYQKSKKLISKISSWMKKTMGYELVVEEISVGLYRLLLVDEKGVKSNLMDVGYGISQILPILIQVLIDKKTDDTLYGYIPESILIIEQPELHLHPAAQSELADLFAIGAMESSKRIIIETHSEHLIRKLQVLVSDPNCKLTNEDVAIYYIDKDESGNAYVKNLKLNPNGKFAEKWPSGFFDKAHELSMELLKNQ